MAQRIALGLDYTWRNTTVSVIEPIPGDWEILQNSHDYEKVEAHTVQFEVPVEKDEEAKLRYRVRIRF